MSRNHRCHADDRCARKHCQDPLAAIPFHPDLMSDKEDFVVQGGTMESPGEYQIGKDAREETLRIARRHHDCLDALGDLYNEHADRHAHAVIRILLALNGGSAIALLAFAGGLAARTTASLLKVSSITAQLEWFVYGVLVTSAAAFFSHTLSPICALVR